MVDATLIAAPSSTKNMSGERDPEMHQSKKGNQWYFGMKAHIGVDADSGLVHTVRGTSGNVSDVIEANNLLHGQETDAFGDAGYQGVGKRPDANQTVRWHVAMRPGLRRALDKDKPLAALIEQFERTKASIRTKVDAPLQSAQATVRVCESALPGAQKEHGADRHAVCAGQSVDGKAQADGLPAWDRCECRRRNAPRSGANGPCAAREWTLSAPFAQSGHGPP